MSDNRYPITGVVVEVYAKRVISSKFSKRQVKIRFTDLDFTGQVNERKVMIEFINEDMRFLDLVKPGYVVQIQFLVDGRDLINKTDGRPFNITALVGFDLVVLSAGDDATAEDRNAKITPEGLEYKEIVMAAKIDQVINQSLNEFQVEDPNFGVLKPKEENEQQTIFGDLPF